MSITIDKPDLLDNEVDQQVVDTSGDALDAGLINGRPAVELRLVLVGLLGASAAGLMAGGIFGSWTARLLGLSAACLGTAWAWLALRSNRPLIYQGLVLPVAFAMSTLALIPGVNSGPARLPHLVAEAIASSSAFRPPVPFYPGWRAILVVLLFGLGFAVTWIAAGARRPQLALTLAATILLLTAISQPTDGAVIAAIAGFVPTLAALALLFGGDRVTIRHLTSQFEARRAIRSVPFVIAGLGLLLAANSTDFLFPRQIYNPLDKPQKPKSVPIGEVPDRVLFEVDGPISGPWKMGTLDVFDGRNWRIPPLDPKQFRATPRVEGAREGTEEVAVRFTIRDLGATSSLPGLTSATRIMSVGVNVVYDARVGVFRVKEGRLPAGAAYTVYSVPYPEARELRDASLQPDPNSRLIDAPNPPEAVELLLSQAPGNVWDRLDFLRSKLNEVVVAAGEGAPDQEVTPARVNELLTTDHEGSPFEIVAAEALLARWAGIPSRIGYGFDGGQLEKGSDGKEVMTVRPKNGATWVEVHFSDFGWVPLVSNPPKAKATLDVDPNARFSASVRPSEDVAAEIFILIELENLRSQYETVRLVLLQLLPIVVALLAAYLALPPIRRLIRRIKRRRWAARLGPRAQVAVEYAEFRDLATDLNVGDAVDTPLEYLAKVKDDPEHRQLAWLTTRVLFGDMARSADDDDLRYAQEWSESLRRRMFRAQPLLTRILAVVGRASLREPYSLELPSVSLLRLPRLSRILSYRVRHGRRKEVGV